MSPHGVKAAPAVRAQAILRTLLLVTVAVVVDSTDFGYFADESFNCPARVTCPQVCTNSNITCQSLGLGCPDGEELCDDGTCKAGTCPDGLESPCNACNPIACRRFDDKGDQIPVEYLPDCDTKYAAFYDLDCPSSDDDDSELTPQYDWMMAPGFVTVYSWLGGVTFIIFAWCAWNQRLFPIGEAMPLEDRDDPKKKRRLSYRIEADGQQSTQTAYRAEISGAFVCFLANITTWFIQILLLILTIFYYAVEEITVFDPVFVSTKEVLFAFELVWMVGLAWSMLLKWPSDLRSLLLRRCTFDQATHVAVFVPLPEVKTVGVETDTSCVAQFTHYMSKVSSAVSVALACLFSDISCRSGPGTVAYCQVEADDQGNRFFYFKLRRYVYKPAGQRFYSEAVDVGSTIADLIGRSAGLSAEDAKVARTVVGENAIHLLKPSLWGSILREFSKPFYVYQSFMLWSWFNFYFWHMGIIQCTVRLVGGMTVAYVTYKNECNLYRLGSVSGDVRVLRQGQLLNGSQVDLVPGDVVELNPGTVHCDLVLLSGNLLVDESALTGEVHPVAKSALDAAEGTNKFSPLKAHKKHVVSAGTTVLECTEQCRALVTTTGSFTAKGVLLRDILFYERHQFQFDVEVKIVVVILVVYAMGAFATVVSLLEDDLVYNWFYGLYAVGTSLPPLLPTVFVVSVGISASRLSGKRVATSNADTLLVAGKVDMAFFDKTGTLTKQGLEFISAQGCEEAALLPLAEGAVPADSLLGTGMAVCHTLNVSKERGVIIGNAVDTMMFETTHAKIESVSMIENNAGAKLKILKRFDFSHEVMVQSVIMAGEDGIARVFVKGSPEAVQKLCNPSTLPPTFEKVARASAKDGVYQIAMAGREFRSDEMSVGLENVGRGHIEKAGSLSFLGFINFKNLLKEDTPSVIEELHGGGVRIIMVTGDNLYTGIKIASECRLIRAPKVLVGQVEDNQVVWRDGQSEALASPPGFQELEEGKVSLAVSGDGWNALLTDGSPFCGYIEVIGRCTPNHKVSVIDFHVKRGAITLMCGDGGNDCGALKTAHCGVALSDAEASIVSPFTSLDKSIVSVVDVLKEGRCCLASAFASYKFMIMYGQVETFLQIINAYFSITFAEWCWVFMDGVWLISFAFSLPLTDVASRLSKRHPTSSLLGWETMSSAVGMLFINYAYVFIALGVLFQQDWFQCRKWGSTDVSNVFSIGDNYESSVLFTVGGFQYIIAGVAFNFGFEHRAPWIENKLLVFAVVACGILQLLVTLVPSGLSCLFHVNCGNDDVVPSILTQGFLPIANPFATTLMPLGFRFQLAGIMIGNMLTVCCWEYFVVNGWLVGRLEGAGRARKGDPDGKRLFAGGATGTDSSASREGSEMEMARYDLRTKSVEKDELL